MVGGPLVAPAASRSLSLSLPSSVRCKRTEPGSWGAHVPLGDTRRSHCGTSVPTQGRRNMEVTLSPPDISHGRECFRFA